MQIEYIYGLMAMVISSISAFATVYMALQLSAMQKTYLREAKAKQMQRTLEAVQLPPSVNKTINFVLFRFAQGDKDLFEDRLIADDVYAALFTLETLATGILTNIYDEEIAYLRLGDSIANFYGVVRRFIYESRSNYTSASLFVQLEQLARRWEDRERFSYRGKGGLFI